MNSVKVLVPAIIPEPAILPFSIYTKPRHSTDIIKRVESVSEINKASLRKILAVCEHLTHTSLNPELDLVVESERLLDSIDGRSWEHSLALGALSLFTNTPLKPGWAASGVFPEGDYSGSLAAVSHLAEKIEAANHARVSTLYLPGSYESRWNMDGLTLMTVREVHRSFENQSGIALWRAITARRFAR